MVAGVFSGNHDEATKSAAYRLLPSPITPILLLPHPVLPVSCHSPVATGTPPFATSNLVNGGVVSASPVISLYHCCNLHFISISREQNKREKNQIGRDNQFLQIGSYFLETAAIGHQQLFSASSSTRAETPIGSSDCQFPDFPRKQRLRQDFGFLQKISGTRLNPRHHRSTTLLRAFRKLNFGFPVSESHTVEAGVSLCRPFTATKAAELQK